MTQENDNGNLLDFTAYKMRNIIEDLAATGRIDYANAMQDALDSYMLGEIDIGFIDGWPVAYETVHVENPNDIE